MTITEGGSDDGIKKRMKDGKRLTNSILGFSLVLSPSLIRWQLQLLDKGRGLTMSMREYKRTHTIILQKYMTAWPIGLEENTSNTGEECQSDDGDRIFYCNNKCNNRIDTERCSFYSIYIDKILKYQVILAFQLFTL